MAKCKICGNAAVIESGVKAEAFEMAAKYRPQSLVLMGGKDDKEEVFRVAFVKAGNGNVSKYGVEFDAVTRNADGFATVTLPLDSAPETGIEDWIADKFGLAILSLNKIEDAMDDVLEDIAAEKESILSNIEVL